MAAGLGLRAACFRGWGLGDDAYYAAAAVLLGRGFFNFDFGSNYRLGLHVPNALALRLLGIDDLGFVLFPLLASAATIVVVYLLGERLAGRRAGLLAALLLATSTFDVVRASSMTIDILTSFLTAAAVWLLLRSEALDERRAVWAQLMAALLLLWAYFIKIPALLVMPGFLFYSAEQRSRLRRHTTFYAALALLLAFSCAADFVISGDPLGYWNGERRTAPRALLSAGLIDNLANYPKAMFGEVAEGGRPFGPAFFAIAAALVYVALRRLPGRRLLVCWLLGLFLLLEFLPNRIGLPYEPLPRFTRYLHALVVPGLLLTAIALDDIMRRRPRLALGVLAALIAASLFYAERQARDWRDGQRDVRQASRAVVALPGGIVYSDNWMLDRINFDGGYGGRHVLRWMQEAIEKRRTPQLLASLGPGYVVTGGGRFGMMGLAVFDLGELRPPPHWRLLQTIPGELRPWRREPLRIFATFP